MLQQKKCHRSKQGKQSSPARPMQVRGTQQTNELHRRRGVLHTPNMRGFAMLQRRFAMRFMQMRTGRMQYAPTNGEKP